MTIAAAVADAIARALWLAAGMAWHVGWSLVLGFVLSGVIQATVSQQRMRARLGGSGVRPVALAMVLGAASSSCSFAAAAVSRTLFKRGASLIAALAYLFAATNLVLELGIILLLLLGWQFMLAEWLGGVLLVAVMALLLRLTCPPAWAEAARHHPEAGGGHDHAAAPVAGATLWQQLTNPALLPRVAQTFVSDAAMLWKDIVLGFLIAGVLGALVPDGWWATLFLHSASPWLQLPANAVIGPLVAMLSFVCSIGNVPLAAILWGSGISFGGVLSFLYADLIVLPLLDVYRRYYGGRMAAYIGGLFFVTMALSGVLMDLAFGVAGLIPTARHGVARPMMHFGFDYTFWLNLVFGFLATGLVIVARRRPLSGNQRQHKKCCH